MIQTRKKNPPQKQEASPKPGISTKNTYDILSQLLEDEEIQDLHIGSQKGKDLSSILPPSGLNKETNAEEKGDADGDTLMQLDAQDLAGINLEKLEEALNLRDL